MPEKAPAPSSPFADWPVQLFIPDHGFYWYVRPAAVVSRSIRGFEPGTRSRMQERMNARRRGYARKTVVAVNPSNRLLRMALEAASLFKTMILGSRIDVIMSPDIALAQSGLSRPGPTDEFPTLR
jgi:hypothetical protein